MDSKTCSNLTDVGASHGTETVFPVSSWMGTLECSLTLPACAIVATQNPDRFRMLPLRSKESTNGTNPPCIWFSEMAVLSSLGGSSMTSIPRLSMSKYMGSELRYEVLPTMIGT